MQGKGKNRLKGSKALPRSFLFPFLPPVAHFNNHATGTFSLGFNNDGQFGKFPIETDKLLFHCAVIIGT